MKFNPELYESYDFSEWTKFIIDNIHLIASIVGVIAFIGYVAEFRPKSKFVSEKSYLDYESGRIIEIKEFLLYWGHVPFLKRIKLPSIERNAKFEILCKPIGKMKGILHTDNFDQNSSGSLTKIYLKNKKHFLNKEIETVFVEINRPAPSDYKDKIQVTVNPTNIEVINENYIEIRQLPIKLPPTITPDRMLQYSTYFKRWETPGGTGTQITAFLNEISPREGDIPRRITIPLV